jgi:hypothetical protein
MENIAGTLEEEPLEVHHAVKANNNKSDPRVLDYRVARELASYGMGAMSISKLLLRSRGLVQSWMKMGESHPLAKLDFDRAAVASKLLVIRRKSTFQNLDFFVATKLFNYKLSSSFISKVLGLPTSTVNSWRNGNVPLSVKDEFMDTELVDSKFQSMVEEVKKEVTLQNMPYLLAVEIAKRTKTDGKRGIGGRAISRILSDHLGIPHIPERTVSSWISAERMPNNIAPEVVDRDVVDRKFMELQRDITKRNIHYHIAMTLHENRGWAYGALSLLLHQDKEKVRGWIRKSRGTAVAKRLLDQQYVDRVLEHLYKGGLPEDMTGAGNGNGAGDRLDAIARPMPPLPQPLPQPQPRQPDTPPRTGSDPFIL